MIEYDGCFLMKCDEATHFYIVLESNRSRQALNKVKSDGQDYASCA